MDLSDFLPVAYHGPPRSLRLTDTLFTLSILLSQFSTSFVFPGVYGVHPSDLYFYYFFAIPRIQFVVLAQYDGFVTVM